ncbi:hypothetical protein FIBSPDRAFT_1046949 [Athelia psychrophila]|uniref:Uncharacterized protein n=1 Tax=Athelia psychrophila TaxID=1759441 RepID=A0A166FXE2_9AGAM|nr:hypothetical protein FIBSPDRAFT_1046949 [Fibularhizoctonia sp. CBS 109695]
MDSPPDDRTHNIPAPQQNMIRKVGGVVFAAVLGHLAMYLVPDSIHALSLAQTALALLAIASLMVMINMQQRTEGNVLSQAQGEVVMIAAFGIFWFAIRLCWRAMHQGEYHPGTIGTLNARRAMSHARAPGYGRASAPRAHYGWGAEEVVVVEEWDYY